MKIAELFVDLGVKGSEKTIGAISGVKQGLKDTASTSLEAKAAIVGAMYALQRLFANSGQAGTNVTNFNSLLGVSATTLQQYQYAARQAGVSNQEVEGSFKSLQSTMTKTLMGEGAPKGLARVSMLTGGITAEDIKRFAEQPQLLIQKLQEYAGKETNTGLRNEVLKSFGIGDGMAAAMSRQAFRPEVLRKAPTYNDGEVKSLDKANIAWSNLGNKIEMAFGHFNAAHGGQMVTDISKVVDAVVKLSEGFVKLAEAGKLFEKLTMVFEGWGYIFAGITTAIKDIKDLSASAEKGGHPLTGAVVGGAEQDKLSYKERIENALISGGQGGEGLVSILIDALKEGLTAGPANGHTGAAILPMKKGEAPAPYRVPLKSIAPPVSSTANGAATTQTIEVNQNLNFSHDGKDAKKTGDSTKKAVQDAFRQMPAQAQGS